MNDLKIGTKVRLGMDSESIYEIIEINPYITKGITIRRFGDGLMVSISKSDITEIIVKEDNEQ
jgi:hypothetical protein